MSKKILKRIVEKSKLPDLLDVLVNHLSLSDLGSLLLEVYRQRTRKMTPKILADLYAQNRFVQPSKVDPLKLLEFDRLAYSLLPDGFEALQLSPVCPLGTNAIVAPVDQNNITTTIRNTEVCSDSTNVLALECARRRMYIHRDAKNAGTKINLCASHRVIRCQLIDEPGAFPHFQLFGIVTAGRAEESFKFEIETLLEHIEFYLRLITNLTTLGLRAHDIRVNITVMDKNQIEKIQSMVIDKISAAFESVTAKFDQDLESGRNYYSNLRFQIFARNNSQQDFLLVDGGFTDWTQQLLNNQKERLLISGIGSERLLYCFQDSM